jgi:integrase
MARQNLTEDRIRKLKPAEKGKRYEILDAITPGLVCRVSDTGRKSFMLKTRFPGSPHPTRRAIGEVGTVTLDAARDKARAWHELLRKGVDPADEEERIRKEEKAKQEELARANASSFEAVAEEYIARQVVGRDFSRLMDKASALAAADGQEKLTRMQALVKVIQDPANSAQCKQRKAPVVVRELDREFIQRWGTKPISEIAPRDVLAVLDAAVERGAEYQAHNLLGHVRRLFNWAIGRDVYGLERSPCDRMRPKEAIGKKALRSRTLDDSELGALWRASARLPYPAGPFFRMLILCGQRKSEVAGARWREFNLEKAVWVIPASRMKMDAAHVVPLTAGMIALLEGLPRFKRGDYLFTTTFGAKPINGFSKNKARLDALMERYLRAFARLQGASRSEVREVTLQPFVQHDIRRTVRTHLSALPVAELVRELVIAHSKSGLSRVYDQYQYENEKRHALELWEGRLLSIVEPPAEPDPGNVVPLRSPRSKRAGS